MKSLTSSLKEIQNSFKVIRARFEENWKFNPQFPQFKSSSRLRKEKQINLLLSHLLLATGALGRLSSWKSFCQKVPLCKVLRQCFRQSCRDKFCRMYKLFILHTYQSNKFSFVLLGRSNKWLSTSRLILCWKGECIPFYHASCKGHNILICRTPTRDFIPLTRTAKMSKKCHFQWKRDFRNPQPMAQKASRK